MERRALLIASQTSVRSGDFHACPTSAQVAELADVLMSPTVGGFTVFTLLAPKMDEIVSAVRQLYDGLTSADFTLLYVSGHWETVTYPRVNSQVQLNLLGNPASRPTWLSLADIAQAERATGSRHAVILDCCWDAGSPEPLGPWARHADRRGDAFLENATDDRARRRSTFTTGLAEVLRDGSADLDGDGDVTVNEWFRRVLPRGGGWYRAGDHVVVARNPNRLPDETVRAATGPSYLEKALAIGRLRTTYQSASAAVRKRITTLMRGLAAEDDPVIADDARRWLGEHRWMVLSATPDGVETEPPFLDDFDAVLEAAPEEFVRGFVQPDGPSFEQMVDYRALLRDRDRLPPGIMRRLRTADVDEVARDALRDVVGLWALDLSVTDDTDGRAEVMRRLAGLLDSPLAVTALAAALRQTAGPASADTGGMIGDEVRAAIGDGDWEAARRMLRDTPDDGGARALQTGFLTLDEPARRIVAGLWQRLTSTTGSPAARRRGIVDVELPIGEVVDVPAPVVTVHQGNASAARAAAIAAARTPAPFNLGGTEWLIFSLRPVLVLEAEAEAGAGSPREFRARTVEGGASCHVIIREGAAELGIDEFAPRLMSQESDLVRDGVEFLVVVSAGAPIAEPLRRLAEDWNRRDRYPFTVVPVGHEELDPAALAARLTPRPRFAPVWRDYLDDPARLCVVGENAADFDESFRQQLPVRALNEAGSLLDGRLLDHVTAWLDEPRAPNLLLLGDFGDGKTFFTYNLARRLCTAAPARIRVPIRLALKELPAAGSGRELLRQRLEYLGADLADWRRLVERYPTLIVLDGFDEMSGDLSWPQIAENLKLLRDCCREFAESKVLITSRPHVFGTAETQRAVLARIGRPAIFRLAPIERGEVLSALRRNATDRQLRLVVDRLQELHDPVGLATKPLYYEMVREMLPRLPGTEFDEHILYESYVRDSLDRKIELLEDRKLRALPEDIRDNLVRIMENVALDLYRTNAAHVHLKDYEDKIRRSGGSDYGFAELLWRLHDGDDDVPAETSSEDARARVGIRSLLKKASGGDEERWPVDFFHRSMREYFVARALTGAIASGLHAARAELGERLLSPEVLHFTGLILRGRADPASRQTLERLAKNSPAGRPGAAGANAASLLLAAFGKLPGDDWAGLNLDGAALAGADLSGKSLRGTTLRAAVLDNADLTGADLRDADLTGVRLQETAAVTAVTTQGDDRVFAAYDDGTVRLWKLSARRAADTVLHTLPFRADRLWFVEPAVLGAAGAGQVGILRQERGEWRLVSMFKTPSRYRSPAYGNGRALIVEELGKGGCAVHRFTPATGEEVTEQDSGAVAWAVHGDAVDAVVSGSLLTLRAPGQDDDIELYAAGVRCVAVRGSAATGFEILTGDETGEVAVHHVKATASGWETKSLSRTLHTGPVESVCFLGQERLVSGGRDRRICVAPLDEPGLGDVRHLQVTFRCQGVRYDGVRGPHEREMLSRLAAGRPI